MCIPASVHSRWTMRQLLCNMYISNHIAALSIRRLYHLWSSSHIAALCARLLDSLAPCQVFWATLPCCWCHYISRHRWNEKTGLLWWEGGMVSTYSELSCNFSERGHSHRCSGVGNYFDLWEAFFRSTVITRWCDFDIESIGRKVKNRIAKEKNIFIICLILNETPVSV